MMKDEARGAYLRLKCQRRCLRTRTATGMFFEDRKLVLSQHLLNNSAETELRHDEEDGAELVRCERGS